MTEQTPTKMVEKDKAQKKENKQKISKGQKEIEKWGVEDLSKENFSLLLNTAKLDKKCFFKADKKPFIN